MVWGVFSLRFPGEIKRLWRGRRIFQVAKWRRQKSRTCPSLHPRFPSCGIRTLVGKNRRFGVWNHQSSKIECLRQIYEKHTMMCSLFFLSHMYIYMYICMNIYLCIRVWIYIRYTQMDGFHHITFATCSIRIVCSDIFVDRHRWDVLWNSGL